MHHRQLHVPVQRPAGATVAQLTERDATTLEPAARSSETKRSSQTNSARSTRLCTMRPWTRRGWRLSFWGQKGSCVNG